MMLEGSHDDNISYDMWLTDALSSGETDACVEDRRVIGAYLIRFNRDIDKTIQQHGTDQIASAIWFIYGCLSGYLYEVLDPSQADFRFEFMNSVKTLYSAGFNQHCNPQFDDQSPLNTACYMLWDMDSIECPAHRGDVEMLRASLDVLASALALDNPACHKSALHGLGHLVDVNEQEVQPVIREYLKRDLTYGNMRMPPCRGAFNSQRVQIPVMVQSDDRNPIHVSVFLQLPPLDLQYCRAGSQPLLLVIDVQPGSTNQV